MDLRPGVQIIPHQLAPAELSNRLSLSSGLCSAPTQVNDFRYSTSAIVPHEPWRPITHVESEVLIGSNADRNPGEWMAIVRIPDEVLEAFAGLRHSVMHLPTYEAVNGALSQPRWQSALDTFSEFASPFSRNHDESEWPPRIRANAPGLPTVTIDTASSCLIGIHLDSWFGPSMEGRHLLPNRIAANLGVEARYLLFINLGIAEIVRLVNEGMRGGKGRLSGNIIEPFATLFPDYPVTRVRLEPGEAYIAPTENIPHDGSTVGMSTWDLHLAELGRFDLE